MNNMERFTYRDKSGQALLNEGIDGDILSLADVDFFEYRAKNDKTCAGNDKL